LPEESFQTRQDLVVPRLQRQQPRQRSLYVRDLSAWQEPSLIQ
jgi:agcS: amino acid carrier protein